MKSRRSRKVPGGHAVQLLLPAADVKPGGHGLHAAPEKLYSSLYDPMSHGVHVPYGLETATLWT